MRYGKMKYSRKEINKIIDLKGANGEQIDIFCLYGLIYLGNTKGGYWDLTATGRFCNFNSHSLFISYSDFDWCKTEEDVQNQFHESLKEAVKDRLV